MDARSERIDDVFKKIVAVMLAIVTVAGAYVAWRASLISNESAMADAKGLRAALNVEETDSLNYIVSNQHRAAYTDYYSERLLAFAAAAGEKLSSATPEELPAVVRDITERLDLATTDKLFFFPARYLNQDDTYNIDKEQAETVAAAERDKDLDPDKHFQDSGNLDEKFFALMAMLIVLSLSLWCFAVAETFDHPAQFALGAGGFIYFILGFGAALMIDGGASPGDTGSMVNTLSWITAGLVALGVIALVVLSLTRRGSTAAKVEAGENTAKAGEEAGEERFKQLVTVLIASATVFAAVLAYIQSDAGDKAADAGRDAQRFAAQSLGWQASGAAQVSYDYSSAARAWKQLDVLATSAVQSDDTEAAKRYTYARDEMTKLSAILEAPYFDQEAQHVPSVNLYESDTYLTKANELSERADIESGNNAAWDQKSGIYITQLTLLAVVLALLGLSLTIAGALRWLFVGAGTLVMAVCLVWMLGVYGQEVNSVSAEAATAYAKGLGLAYADDYAGAEASFNDALTKQPGYANALYERGNARLSLDNFDGAIADYMAARGAGLDDSNVAWDLSYAYYLEGKFDDSVREAHHALALDPESIGIRLSLALSLLAVGKTDEANAEYTSAMDNFSAQVASAKASGLDLPYSDWYFIDAGATELESLYDQLAGQPQSWTVAPARDKVPNPEAVMSVAEDAFFKLRDLTASLEYTGKPATGTLAATVPTFEFGTAAPDSEDITKGDSFPASTQDVQVLYTYEGMKDGQNVLWKVYVDGEEFPEYRQQETWDKGAAGESTHSISDDLSFSNVYTFDPGQYTVEMYVDYQLAQRGYFTIEESPEP